jgi:hypothetical protein
MGLEMSMSSSRKGKEREDQRKRKERLLKEEMERRKNERGREIDKEGVGKRKKSLVSLASSDDLLGRRMLGLVGGLTGTGDGGDADE